MTNPFELVVSVLAVAGQVGLGAVAASRLRRAPTAAPLLGLAACMALWTIAARANRMHLDRGLWHWLGTSSAPWLGIFGIRYVYAFLGRPWDAWASGAALLGGLVALPAVAARWSPAARAFEKSATWDVLLLVSLLVAFTLCVVRLLGARERFGSPEGRLSFRLLGAAWFIGLLGGVSETLADFDLPIPRIGPVALLLTTATLIHVTIRGERAPRAMSKRSAIGLAIGAAAVAASVFAQGLAHAAASPRAAVIIAATVSSLLIVGITVWPLAALLRERRAEAERLVFLGRVSEQLAHDVRNPLAAIRGAADFLRVELLGDPRPEMAEMLEVIDLESRRVEQTLDVYRRLGDLAPETQAVDLAEIAARAIRNVEADGQTKVEATLEPSPAEVDPALVLPALENLLRNAMEAVELRGRVALCTESDAQTARVRVGDDGPGLAPEIEGWITRPYFTTKAQGMGLGLSLVRRVVEAHRGELRFQPSPLGGLEVEMAFKRSDG